MKNDFYFQSIDEKTKVHAIEWVPEGEPVAVLQIFHGMCEYIGRYDEFATYLAEHGFYVVGHDHVGHGESVVSEEYRGFFHEKHGNKVLLEDAETLRQMTEKKHPDVPYFLLGHSMGSFLARQYISLHGDKLSGAVIMGTGSQPIAVLNSGMALCSILKTVKGQMYRSKLVNAMSLGSNNKKFEPGRTPVDWLSKNEPNIDAYISNPWCTNIFTVSAYHDMFYSIKDCQSKSTVARIPKELPLLVVSGKEDPVGGFGKGVEKAYKSYVDAGIKDVTLKLYEDDRHEILNELDREMVYADLLEWFQAHM